MTTQGRQNSSGAKFCNITYRLLSVQKRNNLHFQLICNIVYLIHASCKGSAGASFLVLLAGVEQNGAAESKKISISTVKLAVQQIYKILPASVKSYTSAESIGPDTYEAEVC